MTNKPMSVWPDFDEEGDNGDFIVGFLDTVTPGGVETDGLLVTLGRQAGALENEALANRVAVALNCFDEMLEALEAAQKMIDEALPKFDWGKSALDANAIMLLNETPGRVARAIANAKGEAEKEKGEKPAPIPAAELNNFAMVAGRERDVVEVIDGTMVKLWVGFGWIDRRTATEAYYQTIPQVQR